jgi:hypothetical protein
MPAAPKILAVASATDLDFRYGCTPAWWQIWKGLYEVGVDLIVTPYRGRAVESPWWRTAPNPLYREAELFAGARDVAARLKGDTLLRRVEEHPQDTLGDRLTRKTIWSYVTPRWQRHLDRVLERERDVAAVIVFTVPMAHLRGIPTHLRERYGVPVGYSGHEVGLASSFAAVALGACMVERHITLDRAMWGTDQSASVEPQGLMKLVRDIRVIEQSLGDGVKKVSADEVPIMKKLRRVG